MEQGRSGDQVALDAGTQRGCAGVSNLWQQKAGVREKRIPVFWFCFADDFVIRNLFFCVAGVSPLRRRQGGFAVAPLDPFALHTHVS